MSRSIIAAIKDPFDLARYLSAQEPVYDQALLDLKSGRCQIKWMWYIFPHIVELVYSETSGKYTLRSLGEAEAYLAHPVLGKRLHECAEVVLGVEDKSASELLISPNNHRFYRSMTLFAQAAGPNSVFARVLEGYFSGVQNVEELEGPFEYV